MQILKRRRRRRRRRRRKISHDFVAGGWHCENVRIDVVSASDGACRCGCERVEPDAVRQACLAPGPQSEPQRRVKTRKRTKKRTKKRNMLAVEQMTHKMQTKRARRHTRMSTLVPLP
jgi:hypothetical protein